MPKRKELSGAAKRKAKRLRQEKERRAAARAAADAAGAGEPPPIGDRDLKPENVSAAAPAPPPRDDRPDLDAYRKLGPPPTDPIGCLAYAHQAAGLLLHEVLTDTVIDAKERRVRGSDLIAKIGMTYPRAALEQLARELRERVYGKKTKADDLETADGIAWPATSRLGRRDPGDESPH